MNAVKKANIMAILCFVIKGGGDVKLRNPYLTPLIFTMTCILGLNVLTGCGKVTSETSVSAPTPTPSTTPTDGDRDPILPQKWISTTYTPSTRTPITVASGADLQAAINNAQPGDTLMLEAGATFTGNFVLPKKTGDEFIVIRSAAPDSSLPPEGTRVNPGDHSGAMPKLVSSNADPVLYTANGAHHYRFIGIEFTIQSSVTSTYNLISLGGESSSVDDLPHNLIFDRVYIHGNLTATVRRGIMLNSVTTAVIDSYISDIHENGADSQAICGWNGPGPFKIVNNYLEGAGENVMFGGAKASIQNLIPSDIEFRKNYLFKPLSWYPSDPSYAGNKWSVKNLFEIKNGQRIWVDGNIFENNWADGQNGFAILFTIRTEDGAMPWAVVKDITFSNNIVKHSGSGINLSGLDNDSSTNKGIGSHIKIVNNLFDDISGARWGGRGIFIQLIGGPPYIRVIHNTAVNSGHIGIMDELPIGKGLVFKANIAFRNEFGFYGSDKGEGTSALDYYYPGAVFTDNILIGANASLYPAGNFFPTSPFDLGFRDNGNNQYTPVDTITQRGTDGKKPGVDIDAMNMQIYGKTTF